MPPLSGYVTTLPTNVILGSCVLYIDGSDALGRLAG
jgi:hypothetical protein